jgi:hypothetical protein
MTQVVGYGNGNTNINVFGIEFDQDLSSLIEYHAVDNADFPTTGSLTSTSNEIFSRSSHASGSCICLIDTTQDTAPPASDWKATIPADQTESNPNRLKGYANTTGNYYVEQDGDILTIANYPTGRRATYNMVIEVPSTATTADNFRFDMVFKYTYTVATAPTVDFVYNTGTEGAPTWTSITVDSEGVYHTRSGASSGAYYANIPETGTEDTVEAHVDS